MMAVETRNIADLVELAENPNRHPESQLRALAESIRLWGVVLPLVIDESNVVLAGNGTLAAAKRAGVMEIPVRVVSGWDDQKKRDYAAIDNQLSRMSSWDQGSLKRELSNLIGSEYLDSVGFTDSEIDELLSEAASFKAVADSARSGVSGVKASFGEEKKVPMSEAEHEAFHTRLAAHEATTGSQAGFISSLTKKLIEKHQI